MTSMELGEFILDERIPLANLRTLVTFHMPPLLAIKDLVTFSLKCRNVPRQ